MAKMALSLGCTVWHFGNAEGSRGWSPGLPGWMASSAPCIDPSGAWPGCSCRASCCCSHPAAQLLPAAASAGAASCATLPRSGPPPCSGCTWTRPNSPFLKLHRPRRKFLHIGINGILIFQGCKVATACFAS